jgi:hypothetical protein
MPFRPPNQEAITPQGRGRFPGYDVLTEAHRWDDVTAGVVLARLAPAGDLSFFTATEEAIATALCDLLLAQDCEPRIPVVSLIDARLAAGETDGWRYEDMPEDGRAWRDTLADLDTDARTAHGVGFAGLDRPAAAALIQAVFDRSTKGADFHGRAANHVWSLWTRYATTAFYSHPWAWNEIGFGGPAYPRGYKNVGIDARERWEVADHDDTDPLTFAERVQRETDAHGRLTGSPPAAHGRTTGRQAGSPDQQGGMR